MNAYTDTQLKWALARMLPDEIVAYGISKLTLFWAKDYTGTTIDGCARKVLDTELLHLCWLVEETLGSNLGDRYQYGFLLDSMTPVITRFEVVHATWQQRVTALAKVKRVEINNAEEADKWIKQIGHGKTWHPCGIEE